MTKQNKSRLLLIYNILLITSIIVAGICLIAGCLSIYYSGNGYSSEAVTQTFSKVCIPIYICLGLIVGSFIINALLPSSNKGKPVKHYNQMLANLLNSRDISQCQDELKKINKNKLCFKFANLYIITMSSIYFFIYAINPKHFHQTEINDSMIKAMWVLCPLFLLCFTSAIISHYFTLSLTKKQIEILKILPKKEATSDTVKIKSDSKKILFTKIIIATVAVCILIFGTLTGGFSDVLTKAVNICTECIGLG